MIQYFDLYNRPESPNFTLCNPDYTEISSIIAYNRKPTLRFNDSSSLSCVVYAKSTNIDYQVVDLAFYDLIKTKRLILVENIGYFQIQNVNETDDGVEKFKEITAISIQNDMGFKTMSWFDGTFKFYDALDSTDTIMGKIMARIPDWTIDTISSDLLTKYRTFESVNKTLLDFILSDVSEAYECVFLFDFLNRTIKVKSIADLIANPYQTSIYFSFKNLLKKFQIEELSDDIVTALSVFGQDLDIRQVNPLGTSYIYNFSHFMTLEWMTQDLIDAITAWQSAITSAQPTYAGYLSSLQSGKADLLVLESALLDLQGDLVSNENIRSARIEQGIDYSDINIIIAGIQSDIAEKQAEIDAQTAINDSIIEDMVLINTSLSFASNFTADQLLVLDKYIYEQDYTNTYYIVTDLMNPVDIQNAAQELYNEGVNALARMSQPRYTFKIDSANFMFIKDFATFTSQFQLGCQVTVELDDDVFAYPTLLEIQYNFDDPNDFALTFSDRFKLSDPVSAFEDIISDSHTSANKSAINWSKLNEFSNSYKSDVDDFLTNAFDVSKNAIISSSDQAQTWDGSGMTFRKIVTGVADDEQIKIINNMIVFTDDNWSSIKTVVGKVPLPGGGTAYGVATEVLVGRIILGSSLTISNNSDLGASTFTVDGSGATLINANFSLINSTTKSKILLNPTDGIKIQKNTGTVGTPVWANQFYADADGNIVLTGAITAVSGAIANWTIATNTLSSGNVGLYSGTTYKYTTNSVAKNIRIYAGGTLANTTDTTGIPFVIDEDGRVKMSQAYVSGIVMMNSGSKIGNWNILANSIYHTKISYSDTTAGVYLGTDGINIGDASNFFKVTNAGVLNVGGGSISGSSIYGANYYSTDGKSKLTLISTGSNIEAGLTLYKNESMPIFSVDSNLINTEFRGYNSKHFLTVTSTSAQPQGTWNFQFATVTNISATAVFG